METTFDTRYTQDRELSWLKFDQRVLEEATDPSVPLLERLKFAAIFTSNLDEFFMVRVGSLTDLDMVEESHVDSKSGLTPRRQLQAIFQAVPPLVEQRDRVFARLEEELAAQGLVRLSPEQLEGQAREEAEHWFRTQVRPILSPVVVDPFHPFPHLANKRLTVVLALERDGRETFGLLPIPPGLPPFWTWEGAPGRYVLTGELVMAHAQEVFQHFAIRERGLAAVTRSADITPDDEAYDVDEDFRSRMAKLLRERARLSPVRLEVQGELGEGPVAFLRDKLGLPPEQVFFPRAPISLDFVFQLPALLPPQRARQLSDPPFVPRFPADLDPGRPILPQVLRRDILLFYPYETMEPFLRLVGEAALDPEVVSIKITIYRLATRSRLCQALCRAAERGKDVTVLMELRARFDEENNIRWAQEMERAGCTILYGTQGLKVHSKLCLITRKTRQGVQYITQAGTGNYNEKTAGQYTDLSLMTARRSIGEDAAAFFQNMAVENFAGEYRQLLVSPFRLRERVMELMDGEIAKGREGFIFLKLNGITDRQLIDKLAQASQAGVEVVMNVRGISCLLPGVEGLTDHVTVFSLVGRYLEHSRIYQFGRGEQARLYLSSADFMTRNTQRRVEVACPVLDPRCREKLRYIIDLLCRDDQKARVLGPDGCYRPRPRQQQGVCCQEVFQLHPAPPQTGEGEKKRRVLPFLHRLGLK